VRLSEQQCNDCTHKDAKKKVGKWYGSWGCDGGWVESCWDFAKDHGIMLDSDYPYKGKDKKCKLDDDKVAVKAGKMARIKSDIEDAKIKLQEGPLTIGVRSNDKCWDNYQSGIISTADGCNNKKWLDHCVAIVGLGTETVTQTYKTKDKYDYKCKVSATGICRKNRVRKYKFPYVYCCKKKLIEEGEWITETID